MFKNKIFILILTSILGALLVFLNIDLPSTSIFKIQSRIKNFFKLNNIFPSKADEWKDKYFELLTEFSQLKTVCQPVKIQNVSYKTFPASIIKSSISGYLYLEKNSEAKVGDIVVDKNYVLAGRVIDIKQDYLIVEKITKPGVFFNVEDEQGRFVGVAQSLVNRFFEVKTVFTTKDYIPKYIFTAGGDELYPKGFLVGEVIKQTGDGLIFRSLSELTFGEVIIIHP